MPLERSSGLLLHISSLPSLGGIGDLGPAAFGFAGFLSAASQRFWQVLPLGPTSFGNSPYSSLSAFAGNPLFISLEALVEEGWLERDALDGLPAETGNVRFEIVEQTKGKLLARAAESFLDHHNAAQWERFELFQQENSFWLGDYAAYSVLRREHHSAPWNLWPKELAHRDVKALESLHTARSREITAEKAIQFAFDEQWRKLRAHCFQNGIRMIGDVAIFVNYDSADVWTHPELFDLSPDLSPAHVAGVPPDYFSATGQRWGNPLYRWKVMEGRGFDWWMARIRRSLALFDLMRLDHFRGFEAFWSIPAQDATAVNGEWIKAPGAQLFDRLRNELGELPFLAEDLGIITPEVDALRERFGLPGMRVLQFGFGSRGAHIYLPHHYERNTVVYTGTHDNDTTLGWWRSAGEREKAEVRAYLNPKEEDVVWPMMRVAAGSVAAICLFPVQDVLELGSEARMNTPAKDNGNWAWRLSPHSLTPELAERLARLAEVTDRVSF